MSPRTESVSSLCDAYGSSCCIVLPLRSPMMCALKWLGGSEADYLAREYMSLLVGQWKDLDGSLYVLRRGSCQNQIDVLTIRPSGQRRYTKGLIRIYEEDESVAVFWGKANRTKAMAS